jgi:hypothetical protein
MLEILSGNAAPLRAELTAQGFRWSAKLPHANPGLWHPELQIGATITHDSVLAPATRANIISLSIDSHDEIAAQSTAVCIDILGIEEVIANQILLWLGEGARPGESLALVDVLVGLARAGVGGPFRSTYLERRLARETHGAVTLGSTPTTGLDGVSRRLVPLSAMQTIISRWRACHGLTVERAVDQCPPAKDGVSTIGIRNDLVGRRGRSSIRISNVIPFSPIRRVRGLR